MIANIRPSESEKYMHDLKSSLSLFSWFGPFEDTQMRGRPWET